MAYCIQIDAPSGGCSGLHSALGERGKPTQNVASNATILKVLAGSTLGGRKSVVLRSHTSYKTSGKARPRVLGSEEARSRAGLRPPPKLPVHISCRQLSRRLLIVRSKWPLETQRKCTPIVTSLDFDIFRGSSGREHKSPGRCDHASRAARRPESVLSSRQQLRRAEENP
jgi:hypothetical protein